MAECKCVNKGAAWPSGQRVGLASGGPGFEFYSDHLLPDLFSIVPSSNSSVTNWISPASWGFKSGILYLNFLLLTIYEE